MDQNTYLLHIPVMLLQCCHGARKWKHFFHDVTGCNRKTNWFLITKHLKEQHVIILSQKKSLKINLMVEWLTIKSMAPLSFPLCTLKTYSCTMQLGFSGCNFPARVEWRCTAHTISYVRRLDHILWGNMFFPLMFSSCSTSTHSHLQSFLKDR